MGRDLAQASAEIAADLLDADRLVRAVASGRRRDGTPPWRRVELRYVDLKAGRHLQVVRYDATQATTANHPVPATAVVEELLALPFGNWHVDTLEGQSQLRVTRKGEALLHRARRAQPAAPPERAHDRAKERLLPADDAVLRALGLTDAHGRVKPSRQAKYRQVEELVRALDTALTDAIAAGAVRTPTEEQPLRVVDLGCGNAYLTLAAARFLSGVRGLPVRVVGVDVKAQALEHNTRVAAEAGLGEVAAFVQGTIDEAVVDPAPDVVLALHACDTATDDALARAVGWAVPLVLAAPCCHHDVAAQLRRTDQAGPWSPLLRDGILRERLADTLTDALRAAILREHGYRVDVMEFIESKHTPRNTLLRCVRTGARVEPAAEPLAAAYGVRPRLAELLA